MAASFGLASALSVVVLGDESGYTAERKPEDEDRRDRGHVGDGAGAGLLHRCSAFPISKRETTRFRSTIPYVLGLIATRSLDKPVEGIKPLVERNAETRIRNGMPAYEWLADAAGRAATPRMPRRARRSIARTSAMRCC